MWLLLISTKSEWGLEWNFDGVVVELVCVASFDINDRDIHPSIKSWYASFLPVIPSSTILIVQSMTHVYPERQCWQFMSSCDMLPCNTYTTSNDHPSYKIYATVSRDHQ